MSSQLLVADDLTGVVVLLSCQVCHQATENDNLFDIMNFRVCHSCWGVTAGILFSQENSESTISQIRDKIKSAVLQVKAL